MEIGIGQTLPRCCGNGCHRLATESCCPVSAKHTGKIRKMFWVSVFSRVRIHQCNAKVCPPNLPLILLGLAISSRLLD